MFRVAFIHRHNSHMESKQKKTIIWRSHTATHQFSVTDVIVMTKKKNKENKTQFWIA